MQKLRQQSLRLNRYLRRAETSVGTAWRALDDDPFTFCDPACGCDAHAPLATS
jgi:hypothetical protein